MPRSMAGVVIAALLVVPGTSRPVAAQPVEILRDAWGIPHVFADTDEGSFYGLGYAAAEDRGFQMHYALRIVQGRLSEVVGRVPGRRRDETSVDHDRKMRTFGFHRAARRTVSNLDADTRRLLGAYCEGVNAWFHDHPDRLHPLFAETGLVPEPWTPADCLASWWHLGQFFATDGTRDLIASRNTRRGPRPPAGGPGMPPDDEPSVVKRADLSVDWIDRVQRYARDRGLVEDDAPGADGPKFSHAWVVGGNRTTTGSSVLVSDPQTPVRNPSIFYEFHIRGETFNARGIGIPGSPVLLIGFTDRVAWGVTALGADQADLFVLDTDTDRRDRYRFDGEWRPMTLRHETIRVKDAPPIDCVVRETHLGPVATAFCFARPGDGEIALKRIPVCETDRETVQGAIAMMRARTAREFDDALAGWRFPSANFVFGDRDGDIGYRAVGAIPVRSRLDPSHGRRATPGTGPDRDWREILPHDLMPAILNPRAGFLYSGNHRPIESWYPLPLGAMTGTGGDTVRSWRLRERLEGKERFTPEQVRAIHFDSVNPARRDIVRLALHLRDTLAGKLSPDAARALEILEPWREAGASMSLATEGAALARELNTFFRFVNTELAFVYGGGESGLAYFLKTAVARIEEDPSAPLDDAEREFLDRALADAWDSCRGRYGDDPADWPSRARAAVARQRLGWYESLDGFPALDPARAVTMPALAVTDGGTIACQTSQSYTQWVPMHDPDSAESILPIGNSERPDSPSRLATLGLWGEGGLHPAPLSRSAVGALGARGGTIEFPAPRRVDVQDVPPRQGPGP